MREFHGFPQEVTDEDAQIKAILIQFRDTTYDVNLMTTVIGIVVCTATILRYMVEVFRLLVRQDEQGS